MSDDSNDEGNLTEVDPKTTTEELMEGAKRARNIQSKAKTSNKAPESTANKHDKKRKVSVTEDNTDHTSEGSK